MLESAVSSTKADWAVPRPKVGLSFSVDTTMVEMPLFSNATVGYGY